MKTLLLLRHAKSSWDDPSLSDFDRPLARRGKKAAPRMGKALQQRGPLPDLILSSPAVRARRTIEAFRQGAKLDITPQFEEGLYDASSAQIIQIVRRLPDTSSCAMLVGHNPGCEDTLFRLTGACVSMPTAALACIELEVGRWKDVENANGRLVWRLTPKMLGAAEKDEQEGG